MATAAKKSEPFLSDIKTLRARARQHLSEGAVTPAYGGNVEKTISILQTVLATEIVCVLRYTQHAIAATGISSEGVKAEFAQHAKEEQAHMMAIAERINQLGWRSGF
jgi:bacterioferritin